MKDRTMPATQTIPGQVCPVQFARVFACISLAAIALYAVAGSTSDMSLMAVLAAAFAGMVSLTLCIGTSLLQDLDGSQEPPAFPASGQTYDNWS